MNVYNLKTLPEAAAYLNKVVLGMSQTNGIIPKIYNSAHSIQERLASLEENGVPADLLEAVNQAINDLDNAVNSLESQIESILFRIEDTGWYEVTNTSHNVLDSTVFIRKIGSTVNIMGWIEIDPGDNDRLLFTLPVNFRPKNSILDQVAYEDGTTQLINLKTNGRVEWVFSENQGPSTITLNIMFMTA